MAQVNYNFWTQHVQENTSVSSRTNLVTVREWEVNVFPPPWKKMSNNTNTNTVHNSFQFLVQEWGN